MYSPATRNYTRRNLVLSSYKAQPYVVDNNKRVTAELRDAGLSYFAMNSMEARYLPHLIHPDEHIEGAVFGYQEVGFVLLVATNWRVIFLDRKPLFTNTDEVHYKVVSGVVNNHAAFGTTVILHTRVKEFRVLTLNRPSAKKFVNYIETRCMENGITKEDYL